MKRNIIAIVIAIAVIMAAGSAFAQPGWPHHGFLPPPPPPPGMWQPPHIQVWWGSASWALVGSPSRSGSPSWTGSPWSRSPPWTGFPSRTGAPSLVKNVSDRWRVDRPSKKSNPYSNHSQSKKRLPRSLHRGKRFFFISTACRSVSISPSSIRSFQSFSACPNMTNRSLLRGASFLRLLFLIYLPGLFIFEQRG